MMHRRILFLPDSALPTVCRGGIEKATELLAGELARRGNGVRILVWRGGSDVSVESPRKRVLKKSWNSWTQKG